MPRPKRFIIPRSRLSEEISGILGKYLYVQTFFPGSEEHRRAGLSGDEVLVKAFWPRRREQ
jgi:glutathione synthase/RimK-type ligase-like ATP-grasp enzyme